MNEAELLFSEILKTDRLSLYLDKDRPLDKACCFKVSSVLRRRIKGEPIQYILGKTEFMGLEFRVAAQVLIPRPETEILVETAIRLSSVVRISSSVFRRPSSVLNILDLGTGSGCIAISLAKYLPGVKVDAIDISPEALEIAKQNALLNNVTVNFIHGDLFNFFSRPTSHVPRPTEKYDLIVSNPPYIPSDEIALLQPEIQYEPRISLDGGSRGLDFYYRLIYDAPAHLVQGGYLLLEIGFGQETAIKIILENSRKFEIIEAVRDYNGIDRVIVAQIIK